MNFKSLWIIVIFCFFNTFIIAQSNNVGIGTSSPDPSAALQIVSQNQGILIPSTDTMIVNMAQAVVATGLLIYQENNDQFYSYNGVKWVEIGNDNLGNHIANQSVVLNNNFLSGDGDPEGVWVGSDGQVVVGDSTSVHTFTVKVDSSFIQESLDQSISASGFPLELTNTVNGAQVINVGASGTLTRVEISCRTLTDSSILAVEVRSGNDPAVGIVLALEQFAITNNNFENISVLISNGLGVNVGDEITIIVNYVSGDNAEWNRSGSDVYSAGISYLFASNWIPTPLQDLALMTYVENPNSTKKTKFLVNDAGVVLNSEVIDSSSIFTIASTDKGILIPRMSSAQREAILTPSSGLLVYDESSKSFWYFEDSEWKNIGLSGSIKDTDGDTYIDVEGTPDEDNIVFTTRNTGQMIVDSVGNVGIGTLDPNNKLQVTGSVLLNSESESNGNFRVKSVDNSHMLFLDADQNEIGINTNNPQATLHVNGTSRFVGNSQFLGSNVFNPNFLSSSDFRIQAFQNFNMFFVDASTSRIGINTGSPLATLHVNGTSRFVGNSQFFGSSVFNENSLPASDFRIASDDLPNIFFVNALTNKIGINTGNPQAMLEVNGTSLLVGDSDFLGSTVFNENSLSLSDFRIESDDLENMFFVNASTNEIGINTSNPQAMLDVNGTSRFESSSQFLGPTVFNENSLWFADFRIESDDFENMFFVDASSDGVGINTNEPQAMLHVNGTSRFIGSTVFNENSFNNSDFRIESDNQDNMFFVDASSDEIGIRNSNPTSTLDVRAKDTGGNDGIELSSPFDGNRWNINQRDFPNNDLGFYFNGNLRGYLGSVIDVGLIDFTAQHRNLPAEGKTVEEFKNNIGMIVSSSGDIYNLDGSTTPKIMESLPHVALSSKAYDKSIYGVIAGIEDPNDPKPKNKTQRSYSLGAFASNLDRVDENDYRLIINSGGEGGIWVSNYNGNIENGDLVVSSPINGIGMRQDDDLLHNYTVAKIVMDCNFDLNSNRYECKEVTYEGKVYKMAFLACVYKCN